MSIIVGIDVGGSTTKIVGFRGTDLLAPGLVKANDPIASIYGGFGRFTSDNGITLSDIDEVRITGVGSTYIGVCVLVYFSSMCDRISAGL